MRKWLAAKITARTGREPTGRELSTVLTGAVFLFVLAPLFLIGPVNATAYQLGYGQGVEAQIVEPSHWGWSGKPRLYPGAARSAEDGSSLGVFGADDDDVGRHVAVTPRLIGLPTRDYGYFDSSSASGEYLNLLVFILVGGMGGLAIRAGLIGAVPDSWDGLRRHRPRNSCGD